jgi:GPH family glycoside/pentoside/hexuronide:cation symporter
VIERISRPRAVAYALGSAGFQVTGGLVVSVGLYFYLPPADTDLVPQLPTGIVLGVLTAYGLARLIGGVFDSLADPIVGFASDASRSRHGRRRAFLIAGLLPMVLAPVALFWPPGAPGSGVNVIFLAALLAVYYVFFTVYVAPYLALLPELARDQEDRVRLSTLMAVVALPIVGAFAPLWLWGVGVGRAAGLDGAAAIRAVVLVWSALALVLCLAPILAVDERRFARGTPSTLRLGEALATTLRNRPFLVYLGAQVFFILGVNMLGPLAPYLSVVVLGRDEAFAARFALATALPAVAGFGLMRRGVARFGPRRTLVACTAAFGLALTSLGLLEPDVPGGPNDRRNLLVLFGAMALVGFPVAGFMVVPNVIIGQLIDQDAARTGANRAGMYFGVQGLLTKWVFAASAALLSLLFAKFGNSRGDPEGVLLAGPVAGILCLAAAAAYAAFPEHAVALERVEGGAPCSAPGTCDPPGGSAPGSHP